MAAFVSALFMVVVAEMGDKTQLIAMAFAARYRAPQVLWGVFIGSLLNHGMAVLVGTYLGEVVPLGLVSLGAGLVFLVFGLLALRPEKEEAAEEEHARFGPVATVALSFFLGEMADKTQLTTLTLAVEHRLPLFVLGGAVLGMMAANGPAVLLGDWIFKRVSQRTIRLCSAGVFLVFGLVSLYETQGLAVAVLAATVTALAAALMLRRNQSAASEPARRAA